MATVQAPICAEQMTAQEYFAAPGLSNSGMKDLEVSPLRYWFLHINPNRPAEEETPAQKIGTALHCAVLQPDQFADRYAMAVRAEDYPDCLRTMDDLRVWLREKDLPVTGKNKKELIVRALAHDPSVQIFDLIEEQRAEESMGKTILNRYDWDRVQNMASVLRSEPTLEPILANGRAEVPMFAKDAETGVILKAKLDWVVPEVTLDIKTFSQMRGKSIDKSVADAIYYEGYNRQAYLYTLIRRMQPGGKTCSFVMPFVESEQPHEVRIKRLQPTSLGCANQYWEASRLRVRQLARLFADCWSKYGDAPWTDGQQIEELIDDDIPQLAYER